jgi:hypothetical protein
LPGWTDTELLAGGAGFIDEKNYDLVRKYTIHTLSPDNVSRVALE